MLISILGIAESSAARILGEVPNIAQYQNVKAIAAYAGLSPRHYQSGKIETSSSFGENRTLTCATIHRSCIAELLRSGGKARMTIVAAAMRKLMTLAYGILESGRAFAPAFGAA